MNHSHAQHPLAMFLAGPGVVVLFVALFALVALCASAFGWTPALAKLLEDGTDKLRDRRAVPMIWGLSATLLICLLALLLVQTKVLGLLGVLVLVAGCVLVSLGLAIAALWTGSTWLGSFEIDDESQPRNLAWGFCGLLVGSCIPLVGWIVVVAIWASGFGTLLELILTRKPPASPAS